MPRPSLGFLNILLAPIALTLLLQMPAVATPAAAASLELDLKDLKKPPVTGRSKKQATTKLPAKQPATAKTAVKKPLTAPKVVQPVSTAQKAASEELGPLVLLDSASACPLARQLLEAVADPLPVDKALNGLSLPAAAAARLQGATAVLACGLPAAEAYTFRRLLETKGLQLISLVGDEQADLVVQSVAQGLGLTFRQLQENPASYLVTGQQGRPIRIMLRSGAGP